MVERLFMDGCEAIARGAIAADCKAFFGYPISPQNAIGEYMAREMPKLGGVFVQTHSEAGSIYMLAGGARSGERCMTSTGSPGLNLMSEGIMSICRASDPCVLVAVCRIGNPQQGQTDYSFVTKAPGTGGIHPIVLAPWSPQEHHDLIQLAFYLSEKHLTMVILLTDTIGVQLSEAVELRTLDFGPRYTGRLHDVCGTAKKGGKRSRGGDPQFIPDPAGGVPGGFTYQKEKQQRIKDAEVRYETYLTEDANFLITAYGSSARMSKRAVDMARAQGLKVGLFRPITVWPFPTRELREAALRAGKVLCVDDSEGQFFEDVEATLVQQVPSYLLGLWGRNTVSGEGIIHPDRILQEVKNLR